METIQHTEEELLLLQDLRNNLAKLQRALPDTSMISFLIRETVRLEESLRITRNALQQFMDTSEKNNAIITREYEESENLARHIFD